jgi:exodeoxyribonuclease VII small subunit
MGNAKKQSEDLNNLTFEKALFNLEEIIQRMESGDAPLQSLVDHYQTGIKMLKFCRKKIEGAEIKIKEVQEKEGKFIDKNFEDIV